MSVTICILVGKPCRPSCLWMWVVHVLVLIYRGLEWLEFPVSYSST